MKKKISSIITAVVLSTTVSGAAIASDNSFYLKADGGKTKIDSGLLDTSGTYTCGTIAATVTSDDEDSGYGISGGYHLTENFSIEAGYKNLGEVSENLTLGTGTCSSLIGTITVTAASEAKAVWESDGWTLGGAYSFPVNDSFTIGATAGAYFWDVELDVSASAGAGSLVSGGTTFTWSGGSGATTLKEDGTDIYYGINANYDISDNMSAGIGYQLFKSLGGDNVGGTSDMDYLYASLRVEL